MPVPVLNLFIISASYTRKMHCTFQTFIQTCYTVQLHRCEAFSVTGLLKSIVQKKKKIVAVLSCSNLFEISKLDSNFVRLIGLKHHWKNTFSKYGNFPRNLCCRKISKPDARNITCATALLSWHLECAHRNILIKTTTLRYSHSIS